MSDADLPIDPGSFSRLVLGARQGDEAACSEICRQVQQHLEGMAARDLDQRLRGKLNPSDIAQQAMLRMVDGLEDFRGSSSGEFYAWLNAILKNEIYSTRRDFTRQRRDVRREDAMACNAVVSKEGVQENPERAVHQREQLERFREVIQRLPEDYATVIQLRSLEEMPFAEVADRMGRSVDAVSKLWSRALVKLTEELNKLDESIS
jgi:RNA polymerase sigma-70 factor (ECF subfamily)